jgi:hypothetical protein
MKSSEILTIRESGSKKNLRGFPNNGKPGRTVKGVAQEALLSSIVSLAKSLGSGSIKLNKGQLTTYAPSAIGRTVISSAPRTQRSKSGTVCISHREMIEGSIGNSSVFEVQNSFFLQPGNKATFPWLSVQAAQYEQYRFKRLSFQYVPIVGTSVAGDVMLLADYNVQDPVPSSEQEALDHPGSRTGSVWETHTFKCDLSKMHALGPRKYVRTSAVAGDPKTYDCGQFHICTNNIGSVGSIGKLFVDYEVEFSVPQLNPRSELAPTLTSYLENPDTQSITTSVEKVLAFGNNDGFDPLRIFNSPTPLQTIFTPPAGCYRISFRGNIRVTINALNSYSIYFLKSGAISPAAMVTKGYLDPYVTTLTHENIISFDGDETLEVAVLLVAAGSGVLNAENIALIFTLA